MIAQDAYDQYQLMPMLQQHQLRVAGVALILAEHSKKKVDLSNIVTACLVHDMGNIVKFDLGLFPGAVEPQGLEYWQGVKNSFIAKYGQNSHLATVAICREIGLSPRVIELVDAISFNHEQQNYQSSDYSRKICAYADMRVSPQGVASLEDRLEDARLRYSQPGKKDTFHFVMRAFLKKIELQLIEATSIDPRSITENEVELLGPRLKAWPLID